MEQASTPGETQRRSQVASERQVHRVTLVSLLACCTGIGLLVGASGQVGWWQVACALTGGATVILAAGRLVLWGWEQVAGRERAGRARAETLLRRMPREEAPLEDEPYDPESGRGVGVYVPDPRQRDLERVGGVEGLHHLLLVFSTEEGRRQRLADRLLLYLGVDARTGESVHPDRAFRLQQRRRELRAAEDPHASALVDHRHLVGGAVLLAGMASCCLLAWGGAETWVILVVALVAGTLVSLFT